jgi:hypothetical protein
MCEVLIVATFKVGEQQTIRCETREDADQRIATLRDNPECVAYRPYYSQPKFVRVSAWEQQP